MISETESLQSQIGHDFKNQGLLERALTHASLSKQHNQRLEYLGDALLGLIISDCLYAHHQNMSEGILTRQRAHLVSKPTLLKIASRLKLHCYVRVGSSLRGDLPDSILADTVEALFAAVYLDAGLTQARQVVVHCYQTFFDQNFLDVVAKDSKTLLQEFCQKQGYALPLYEHTNTSLGEETAFTVRVTIVDLALVVQSQAGSKRQAEKEAAAKLLIKLEEEGKVDYGSNESRRS